MNHPVRWPYVSGYDKHDMPGSLGMDIKLFRPCIGDSSVIGLLPEDPEFCPGKRLQQGASVQSAFYLIVEVGSHFYSFYHVGKHHPAAKVSRNVFYTFVQPVPVFVNCFEKKLVDRKVCRPEKGYRSVGIVKNIGKSCVFDGYNERILVAVAATEVFPDGAIKIPVRFSSVDEIIFFTGRA